MSSYMSSYDYFNTKLKIVLKSNDKEVIRKINHRIDLLANEMQYLFNYYDVHSDVYKLNRDKKIVIGEDNKELADIILLSIKYKSYTNNYFNIDNTFMDVDTIFINEDNISIINEINLNSIVKGFLLDKCSSILNHYSIEGYINLGGSILNYYPKLTVGVRSIEEHRNYILNVDLHRFESIHTTANYEQKAPNNLNYETRELHHLETNNKRTVSVIDIVSSKADALATALYAMDLLTAIRFCKANNVKAIIVEDNNIYISKNMDNAFKKIDPLFKVFVY